MKQEKRKRKNSKKNNTQKKNYEQRRTVYSSDDQSYYLSGQPATDAMLERFADDQLEYYNTNPDVYNMEKYRITRGVPKSTYFDWLKRNAYLKAKHDFCLEIIALRRKERVTDHDPKFLTHTLHTYDEKHDRANKYKAALRDYENESKSQSIRVVFEDYKKKDADNKNSDVKEDDGNA